MYTENIGKDAVHFAHAFVTNQIARFAPAVYLNLSHQTGRGSEDRSDAAGAASYFLRCVDDYQQQLGMDRRSFQEFLRGKAVLEYGPGDVLGVALLLYAHGAEFIQCVDRFAREKATAKNIETYVRLLESLDGEARERANGAFRLYGDPASGFDESRVKYSVTTDGLIGQRDAYDLVISRSVLEHVNSLDRTMADMAAALRKGGIAIHKVDLKSHQLDRYQPFDFLTWPEPVYRLMHSHKGRPNRWRVNKYREVADRVGLRFRMLADTGRLEPARISRIRPKLASHLRDVPDDELTWLGFWMVLEHA